MAVGVVAAALGPADDGEEAHALRVQPGPLLPGREVDVRLGPLARPVVLVAVEAGGAEPVLEGQVVAVLDPQPALLGRVDEEEAAEGPVRLAADGLLGLLVEQDDRAARVDELGGGREPASPAPITITSASYAMGSILRGGAGRGGSGGGVTEVNLSGRIFGTRPRPTSNRPVGRALTDPVRPPGYRRSVSVLVLLLSVGAACCLGFGFVLQQDAARRAPLSDFLSPRLLLDLMRVPSWLAGIGLMVCGMVLGALALGQGEVSVVEPLLATNLLFALALSRHRTGQPLGRQGWGGLCLLAGGVTAFLAGR